MILLVAIIAFEITLPHFSRYFIGPPHELSSIAGLNLGPEDRFIVYGRSKPSVLFYAKRTAIIVKPGEEHEIDRYVGEQGRTIILLPSRLKPKLPAEVDQFSTLLERYGYTLLSNHPVVNVPVPQSPAPH